MMILRPKELSRLYLFIAPFTLDVGVPFVAIDISMSFFLLSLKWTYFPFLFTFCTIYYCIKCFLSSTQNIVTVFCFIDVDLALFNIHYSRNRSVILRDPFLESVSWTSSNHQKRWPIQSSKLLLVYVWCTFTARYSTKCIKMSFFAVHKIDDSIWNVLFLIQILGGMYLPKSDSGRIIVGTWWLVVLVIVTTYCGNLVAFLTFPKMEMSLNTVQQLITNKKGYTWSIRANTYFESYLKVGWNESKIQF